MADFGDVIIVIPGIFGSRLEREDGTLVYDLTLAGLPRTLWTLAGTGASHLNADSPPDDGVSATDLFNYQLLPGFFGNDDYDGLIAMLRASVKYPDQQVVKFPYDWRASNRWAAERLDRVARAALKAWQESSGNASAKLWLLCHSMGGLVARYFCEHLGGAEITCQLITIGTPHRGAAEALDVLINGKRLGGLVNVSRFVRSLPSVYELLPQYPVLREPDGGVFRLADAYGFGDRLAFPKGARVAGATDPPPTLRGSLPALDRAMLRRAISFHAAIRNPVVERANQGAPPPYGLRCILNRRQPTVLSALGVTGGWEASEMDALAPDDQAPDPAHRGDGTVPAFAAIPIEWENTADAVPVATKHVGMPASKAVIEVLHNWIRPQDARAHMGGGVHDKDVLGLRVPGAMMQGDELFVAVDALSAANVTITLEPVEGGRPGRSTRARLFGNAEPVSIGLGTANPGAWRVVVTSEDRRRPTVSDYVVVLTNG